MVKKPKDSFTRGNAKTWRYSEASPVLNLDLDLDGTVRPVTGLQPTAEVTAGADGFTPRPGRRSVRVGAPSK
jgi:hypothetical protein